MLMYMTGRQPWTISVAQLDRKYGLLAFQDVQWKRDSHCIVVKHQNNMTEETTDAVISILINELCDDEIEMILQCMIKRMTTMKVNAENKDIITEVGRISRDNEDGEFDDPTKKQILNIWFGDVLLGPFLITRSLSVHEVDSTTALMDPVTQSIKNQITTFFELDVHHITILDDRYFAISGLDADNMQWPNDIECCFVEVAEPTQHVEAVREKIVKRFKQLHITGYPESKQTAYRVCVVQGDTGCYLKMRYGSAVYYGVNNVLTEIFNSRIFNLWAKSLEVDLDPWCGRDENDKIDDYRTLIDINRDLQTENQKLKKQLEQMKK